MDVVALLQINRKNYENKIAINREQIRQRERSYESLAEFKRIVQRSQEDFHTINSSKTGVLSEVQNVKKNSITAQRYYTGMQNEFSGIGIKFVGGAYDILLASMSSKLKNYLNEIDFYENEVTDCQEKIAVIDSQILKIQRENDNAQ